MSLWVNTPTVVRTRDERVVVELPLSWDSSSLSFPAHNRVRMKLRRYPEGDRIVDVVVDVETESWWFADTPEEKRPAATLPEALEAGFDQQARERTRESIAAGICPYCISKTIERPGPIRKLLGDREIYCLICERRWRISELGTPTLIEGTGPSEEELEPSP